MTKQTIDKIKKFGFEFFTIFIGIFAAFALDNWNENRKDQNTEIKILTEIRNGLIQDSKDLELNELGHSYGLRATNYFSDVVLNKPLQIDSLKLFYVALFRDFLSIQNTSGYETLKSKGLEIIGNDSLRAEILSLYENDYNALRKLEENYAEAQFFENYFRDINNLIAPNFTFDEEGNLVGMKYPLTLTEKDRKILLTNLERIKHNRSFMLRAYGEIKIKVATMQQHLKQELNE